MVKNSRQWHCPSWSGILRDRKDLGPITILFLCGGYSTVAQEKGSLMGQIVS